MKILDIEIALYRYFKFRQALLVPNLKWGLNFNHELDLSVITKSGYLYEIEIKTSMADLKKDSEKRHQHRDWRNRIKRFYFAIPESLPVDKVLQLIPEDAGLIVVNADRAKKLVRKPKERKGAIPLTNQEIMHLSYLFGLRVWTLKEKLYELASSQKCLIIEG